MCKRARPYFEGTPMISSKTASIRVALCATALLAVAGCRETTTCADNPSPVCPDAAGPAMDGGPPDAFRRPDANLDAPGLDAFEVVPDAWTPDDAWAPDAGSDAGPCSRCPSATPACFMDTCVECASNADCVGAAGGPACDLDTHTCVACTVGTDCTAPLAACLPDTNTCVRCDDRPDCAAPTPACVANNCVQCENRSDCSGGTPACVGNACVQCENRSDCSGGTPACFGNACVQCEANTDCTSVSASRCNVGAHACAACTGAADCAHIPTAQQCLSGTCVQCLNNTHCGASEACDTSTNRCVPITLMSVGRCGTCLRDTQCMAGMLCVPMVYDDPNTPATDPVGVGLHCLHRQDATGAGRPNGDCLTTRPHTSAQTLTSVDGVSATMCALRLSTCEAQMMYDDTNCMTLDAAGDARCGLPGVGDGVCRMRSATTNLCSVYCQSNNDCPGTCDTSGFPRVCNF